MSRRFRAPVRDGNRFTLLSDARVFFARMLAAIDESKYYVLAEFYLVESGRVTDLFIAAFARAAARGIRVRVLFDAFGARGLSDADGARLRAADVDLVFFNRPRWRAFPHMFVRDHRKLVVWIVPLALPAEPASRTCSAPTRTPTGKGGTAWSRSRVR